MPIGFCGISDILCNIHNFFVETGVILRKHEYQRNLLVAKEPEKFPLGLMKGTGID